MNSLNNTPSIVKISSALLKAQKEIGGAKKGADNPFFKKKYADLGAVMEACKDAFNENGITVLQPVISEGDNTYVETVLLHESGEFISAKMIVSCKNKDNPQEMGSAISYAKRYSLQAIAFIPSEDDDGESVAKSFRAPAKPEAPKPVTQAQAPTPTSKPLTLGDEIDAHMNETDADKQRKEKLSKMIWAIINKRINNPTLATGHTNKIPHILNEITLGGPTLISQPLEALEGLVRFFDTYPDEKNIDKIVLDYKESLK
jgi:hypothetical protein